MQALVPKTPLEAARCKHDSTGGTHWETPLINDVAIFADRAG